MRAAKPIFAAAIALAAAGLSFDAYRMARADTLVGESNAILESAEWRKSPPSLPAWLAVRGDLLEAASLVESPAVFESLGVLHARRSASNEFMAYARDYFRRALELRPDSPYTWANYAEIKYFLGETGPDFERALERAVELGPWEREVQVVVTDIGLAMYRELQPATRAAVDRMIGFGMRRAPLDILQVAEKRGRLDLACAHVPGNKRVAEAKWIQLCDKGKTT